MTDPYTRLPAPASAEDCIFYHEMEIPGHGLVHGWWDLRGGEREYLGGIELAGRRVLEIGPASGFLTFHMEAQGAEVVAVELAPDAEWDIVPHALLDLEAIRAERRDVMDKLRNGFWFAHERFGSRARVHYGSAYDLPEALGRFDVALMAAVLLHTRDPLRVIENCAARADRVVITEMHLPELDGAPVARFYPSRESDVWHTWWHFTPEMLSNFLGVLGFARIAVTRHTQTYRDAGQEFHLPQFTVVADRE